MSKRYYWLKLQDNFFQQKPIKKLRKIAGGDTYTIIYLKMLLVAMKQDGKIYFDGVEDTFLDELALDLDEERDDVEVTVMFLLKQGLMRMIDESEYMLEECSKMTGSEGAGAERMRRYRSKKELQSSEQASLCDNGVTDALHFGDGEIEIEKEKDIEIEKERDNKRKKQEPKHHYGEYNHVLLTDRERDRLINDYGEAEALEAIKYLDEYIQMKGYKARDHNLAIRKWVFKAIERERRENSHQSNSGGIDWSSV